MWLNDIRNGHYGDAIPQLEQIEGQFTKSKTAREEVLVRISDAPYPNSIMDLARVLQEMEPAAWCPTRLLGPDALPHAGSARRRDIEQGPQVLARANRIRRSYVRCTFYRAQRPTEPRTGIALATRRCRRRRIHGFARVQAPAFEERVGRAWASWGRAFACRSKWQLKIYRNGIADRAN